MAISASISTLYLNNIITPQTFNAADSNIIPNFNVNGLFDPQNDNIEFFIYDKNNNLLSFDYDFRNWVLNQDSVTALTNENVNIIGLNPINDVVDYGYNTGEVNVIYNFISNELGSSYDNPYYIDEVSADRTELRLKSNVIQTDLVTSFAEFSSSILGNNEYFDEFYLNFGENNYFIGINALLDSNSVLIKLYEPLPPQFDVNSTCYVVTKTAESVAYNIQFGNTINIVNTTIPLRGPNYNIEVKNLGGARLVVEGEIGVGKTTFVNYHRSLCYLCRQKPLFTTVPQPK
jgi:hypothetical protein